MNIAEHILTWYKNNQRPLPWRSNKNPYSIWVSEIIMQQTRIEQGTPYYLRFMEKFATVEKLASAPQSDVLHLWQGLGYYSRARNMHEAAKQVVSDFNGRFPESASELKKLKGIGEYTSAAIASFCFGENIPAIDGNVYRVVTRLFDIDIPIDKAKGKHLVKEILIKELKNQPAGDFNQGMMDFGSLICKPKSPNCHICPFINNCQAYINKSISLRPVKSKKIISKSRYFYYFVPIVNGKTLVNQRKDKDIWQGLYQFPLLEHRLPLNEAELLNHAFLKELIKNSIPENISIYKGKPHILSHQVIHNTFIKAELKTIPKNRYFQLVPILQLKTFAFPVLITNFINRHLLNE